MKKVRTHLEDRVLPSYTKGEEIFNMVSHIAGGALAIAALVLCVIFAVIHTDAWGVVGAAIYGSTMVVLYAMSSIYHGLKPEMPKKVFQVIDHCTIYFLIAGTYTPVSFALEPFWRNSIIAGMWICTTVALIIHVIWISAPRWLYVIVYIIFGVSGVAFMGLFWISPYAGPAVVVLLAAGGACYIAGAIVYALRKPDPWPKVFGFHEIFHCGTVAGYACHMVAIYMVIVQLWP